MISRSEAPQRVRCLYEDGGDPEFRRIVETLSPLSDRDLAEAIEVDGRVRLALGRDITLERYLAGAAVEVKPVALDAAIEMALRASAHGGGPGEADVAELVRQYPRLERLIREAALLGNALSSTTSMRRRFSTVGPERGLPCDFGPQLDDGRSRYRLVELLGQGANGAV
jgi:hypothetical protein